MDTTNEANQPFISDDGIEADILNLRTYDVYDWFLLVFGILFFGCVCLVIGCLWNRRIMRNKFIHTNETGEKKDSKNKQIEYRDKKQLSVATFENDSYEDNETIEINVDMDVYNH
eukprot:108036_1